MIEFFRDSTCHLGTGPLDRISCLTVSILGMLIFMLYRGTLNASLNVKRTELPIKSWNDVLASRKDLLVWEGASAAEAIKGFYVYRIQARLRDRIGHVTYIVGGSLFP